MPPPDAPNSVILHPGDHTGVSTTSHVTNRTTNLRFPIDLTDVVEDGDQIRFRLDDGETIVPYVHLDVASPGSGTSVATLRVKGPLAEGTYAGTLWLKRDGEDGEELELDPPLVIDTTAPTIESIEIVSTPLVGTTYAAPEDIQFKITWDEPVYVIDDDGTLTVNVGGEDREAYYSSGSGTDEHIYVYEVIHLDEDTNGISVAADSLAGTMTDEAGNAADMDHDALAANADHKIDATGTFEPEHARVGLFFDFADTATMYETAAGETPNVDPSISDPIGKITNKGTISCHAAQGSAGSRPLAKTDGTLNWSEYDGVNDLLALSVDDSNWRTLTTVDVFVAFRYISIGTNSADNAAYANDPIFNSYDGYRFGLAAKSAEPRLQAFNLQISSAVNTAGITTGFATGTDYVARYTLDGTTLTLTLNDGTPVSVATNTMFGSLDDFLVFALGLTAFANVRIYAFASAKKGRVFHDTEAAAMWTNFGDRAGI